MLLPSRSAFLEVPPRLMAGRVQRRMRTARERRVAQGLSLPTHILRPSASARAAAPADLTGDSARHRQFYAATLADRFTTHVCWCGGRVASDELPPAAPRRQALAKTSITHQASAPICHQPYDTATRGTPSIVFPGCPDALFHLMLTEP